MLPSSHDILRTAYACMHGEKGDVVPARLTRTTSIRLYRCNSDLIIKYVSPARPAPFRGGGVSLESLRSKKMSAYSAQGLVREPLVQLPRRNKGCWLQYLRTYIFKTRNLTRGLSLLHNLST